MKLILLIIFLISNSLLNAQSVADYQFKNYKTPKIVNIKKAPLDFKSNTTAKLFKTIISDKYKNTKIDFSTYYITVVWGCGTGCINGAMIDVRDGKVYDLPLNHKNAYSGCFSETTNNNKEDRYEFNKNSSLFITSVCNEKDSNKLNEKQLIKTYFVNNWDEKLKKFKLIKKVVSKKSIRVIEK